MKTFITSLIFISLIFFRVEAQKADIDNFRVYISNAKLPTNYVPVEKRTYNVKVSGNWNNQDLAQSITLLGWDLVNENPSLELRVKIDPMIRGNSSLKSRVDEKKDKNGKVTSSTTYYSVTSSNQGNGSLLIYGMKNEQPRQLSKKELEKQAKKEKEKKEKESNNPFLASVDTKDVKEYAEEGNSTNKLAYNINLDQSYSYTTSESTSSSVATKEYNLNANSAYQNHMNEFIKQVVNKASDQAAYHYSYSPVKNWVKFKELDSEKHPEFTMYDNATKALKTIFSKMRYNQPVDVIETDLTPIIKYFDGVEQKYTNDEKYEKRLRAATLYNLAVIFQYLDRHDKAIEIGNKMISLDLEKGDGEDIIEESTKIKKQLEFHQMKSRHIIPRNDAEKLENEGKAEESDETKP